VHLEAPKSVQIPKRLRRLGIFCWSTVS